jgi:hypothetical protein
MLTLHTVVISPEEKKRLGSVARQARYAATPKGALNRSKHNTLLKDVKRIWGASKTGVAYKLAWQRQNRVGRGKAISSLRTMLHCALRRVNLKKAHRTDIYFGCTVPELKAHIESLWSTGMTWGNRHTWHIDHIKPLAAFDRSIVDWELHANHYTNLQPLWAADNLAKGAKWVSGCSEELAPQPN